MNVFVRLQKLKKNNKGASFFIVIVAMLFLTVLSTALIYSSFTAYNVKVTSKRANTAFYTVDNAMEEIKTGFQNVVSKCAKDGYEKALLVYNDPSKNVSQIFADTYKNSFENYKYDSDKNLFVPDGSWNVSGKSTGKVKNDGILSFIDPDLRSRVKIANETDPAFEMVRDANDLINIYIKNLKVEFTDQGYTSYVTTDIKLMMPQVVIYGDNSANPLDKFVMIADKGIDTAANAQNASNSLTISGDAFFGDINITQAKTVKMLDNSTLYVGAVRRKDNSGAVVESSEGKISVSDNAKFFTGNGSTLWAKDIELSERAKFIGTDENTYNSYNNNKGSNPSGAVSELNSKVSGKPNTFYIADDLSLSEESEALITGYYYGIGDGTKTRGDRLGDYSEYSSAIIFPRRATKNGGASKAILDLNACREFSLGGTAYVKDSSDGGSADLQMGSSIASTKEQLVYLAPASFFSDGSNPMLLTGSLNTLKDTTIPGIKNEIISQGRLTETPLFRVNGAEKFASDYNLTTENNLSFFVKKLTAGVDQYAVYCFFKFNNTEDSNRYFRDYLSSNLGQDITKYLNDYAEIRYNSANIFALNGTELIPGENRIINARGSVANTWINDFINISQTMSRTVPDEHSSPFYYNVDADKIKQVVQSKDIDALKQLTGYTEVEIDSRTPANATYCVVKIKQNDPKMTGVTVDVSFIISSDDLYIGNSSYNISDVDPQNGNINTCNFTDETLQLILCDGNVVYNGQGGGLLIMCSGKIYPDTAQISLNGGNTGDGEDQKPSSVLKNSGFYRNSTPTGDDNWNIDQQVVFENWKKNEG